MRGGAGVVEKGGGGEGRRESEALRIASRSARVLFPPVGWEVPGHVSMSAPNRWGPARGVLGGQTPPSLCLRRKMVRASFGPGFLLGVFNDGRPWRCCRFAPMRVTRHV